MKHEYVFNDHYFWSINKIKRNGQIWYMQLTPIFFFLHTKPLMKMCCSKRNKFAVQKQILSFNSRAHTSWVLYFRVFQVPKYAFKETSEKNYPLIIPFTSLYLGISMLALASSRTRVLNKPVIADHSFAHTLAGGLFRQLKRIDTLAGEATLISINLPCQYGSPLKGRICSFSKETWCTGKQIVSHKSSLPS